MLTPVEFERRQWAHWKRKEMEQKRDTVLAYNTAKLTRVPRMPSLNVLLNPARNVYGDERAKLDKQHADALSWATASPVKPIEKGQP